VDVGKAVKEGDVVALVETDKVTVDIKAETDGVITSHYCAVDETVEVGSDLYKIDTDATATISDAGSNTPTNSPPSATPNEIIEPVTMPATSTESENNQSIRIPSIHFLGSNGWKMRRESVEKPSTLLSSIDNSVQLSSTYIQDWDPMYGRPAFTEEEMEALIMGGANIAPKLESFSHGAVFR